MTGAELFLDKNFPGKNVIFESCMQSIVHGYQLLEKSTKYSRKEILDAATRVRGKQAKLVELEDFLRNDLVRNFVAPNLSLFGLQNYIFIPGAEESSGNIKTGILDIKVCSPSFTGAVYYIFECKRLNKALIKSYLSEGVLRFIDEKYYPDSETAVAGLISFLEAKEVKSKIEIRLCFNELDQALKAHKTQTALAKDLEPYKLDCKNFKEVDEFSFVFLSSHIRSKKKTVIRLFHIALDYNHLLVD